MAVLDPASVDPADTRPIYDATHLPGGAWHTYRARQVVEAVFVRGPFLVRRPSDGMLVEAQNRWVVLDAATGEPALMAQDAFSSAYAIAD
jgi:hypothetical protein